MRTTTRPRVFYGWIILGGLSLTQIVSWGILYYGFGVFLEPMRADLGWSPSALAGAFSAGLLVSAAVAMPVGRYIDRHGARGIMTLGSCAAAGLLVAWARVESLWTFYAIWVGLGVCMSAVLYEPAFAILVTWFVRRRSEALSVLTSIAGFASTVFVPIAIWLLGRTSWRSALLILAAVLAATTIPIHAFVLRSRPGDVGTWADGDPSATRHEGDYGILDAAGSTPTGLAWTLAVLFAVTTFSAAAVAVHVIPFLLAHGHSLALASFVVAATGAAQVPGRIFFSALTRRVPAGWLGPAVFLLQAVGLACLSFSSRSRAGLAAFAMLFGAGTGLTTLVRPMLVAEWFGVARYATMSGKVASCGHLSRAAGPITAAWLASRLGGYELVWVGLSVVIGASGIILAVTRRRALGPELRQRLDVLA